MNFGDKGGAPNFVSVWHTFGKLRRVTWFLAKIAEGSQAALTDKGLLCILTSVIDISTRAVPKCFGGAA
eukprot:1423791-Amphidinium_carterae.1